MDELPEPKRQNVDPNEKPCKICRRRKVKCSKTSPCTNCRRAGTECVYGDAGYEQLPQSTIALKQKIRQLEDQVASLREQLVSRFEESTNGFQEPPRYAGRATYIVDAVLSRLLEEVTHPVSYDDATYRGRLVSQDGTSRHLTNSFWASMYDEIGSLKFMLTETSTPSTQWLFDNHLSTYQPPSRTLSSAQCAFLMDAYVDNVDQFVRILHKPTLRRQLNHVQRGIAGLEADCQLSAVYNLAILSLSEEDCLIHFGERRDNLLNRLRIDVEQGLGSSNLTTTHRLMSLQTLLLYVSYLVWTGSHVQASSLLGLAVRISQRLGIHRDGLNFGLSPWQTELRRRLWHYIAFLDICCMETHGLESAIPQGFSDTRLPQNNDDTVWDTSDSSTLQPAPQTGFTDMTFALVQYEAGATMRAVLEHSVPIAGREQAYTEFHARLSRKVWVQVESKYLQQLDENDLRQALTLDIGKLIFQRIQITQLRPLVRNGVSNHHMRQDIEHNLIKLSLNFCDTVQTIRTKYASRRLDWAIIRVFSWHALATELSTALSGDVAVSTSGEAQRSREKIAKVFRDRPSIDYIRGGDGLWTPLERLRDELEMRAKADEEARLQEALFRGPVDDLLGGADLIGMEGVWDSDGLWQTY